MIDTPEAMLAAADRLAAARDVAGARALLEQVVFHAPDEIDAWLKLAAMRRAMGELDGALAAISGALRGAPLHFMALLSRARLLEDAGQSKEAAKAYTRALAQRPEGEVPAGLRGLVAHAEDMQRRYRDGFNAAWDRAIADDPSLDDRTLARLRRFKTNATRETRVYHSEPTHFHYPGLTEREFHEREDFPWLAALETATEDIRAEYLALCDRSDARAEPYVQYGNDAPLKQWAALNNSLDWTAFHLLQNGWVVEENARRCPRTMAALAHIPQPHVAGQSPNAMFSLLRPGIRIPPHVGVSNTRLVCHLALIVPEKCWFRVGAETREWHEGEAIVFDDTIEHEAVNDSELPRVVLILDVWHPALSARERAAIKRVMEIDGGEHGQPL